MSAPANANADQPNDAVVNTRDFAAAPTRLYQAFREPAELASWWGPRGFTNTFQKFEFRPGGEWRLTMQAPSGERYENASRFLETTEPSRIVFEHLGPLHWYRMTITLEPVPRGTRLTWHMRFESPEKCAPLRDFIFTANEENFDRLSAHLAREVSA